MTSECTFFFGKLASNFGTHDTYDDIIRMLQSFCQRGKIAAYYHEFVIVQASYIN